MSNVRCLVSFLRFLRTKGKATSSGKPDEAEVFNEALSAYVHTFPQRERLLAYISNHQQQERAADIEASVTVAVKDTEDYVYAQSDGVRWSDEFEEALFNHVSQRSPWLSRSAFRSLVGFAGWLCWHEGLNA
jgi:hypothetical protein